MSTLLKASYHHWSAPIMSMHLVDIPMLAGHAMVVPLPGNASVDNASICQFSPNWLSLATTYPAVPALTCNVAHRSMNLCLSHGRKPKSLGHRLFGNVLQSSYQSTISTNQIVIPARKSPPQMKINTTRTMCSPYNTNQKSFPCSKDKPE